MPRTVLIVDDNPSETELLSAALNVEYEILTASGTAEMILVLGESAERVSAILLDIIMPDVDGFEALRLIRENAVYRQIPVIVVTGLTDENSQVRAMSLGAYGYICKPFNKELMSCMLDNAISLRETSALANALRRDSLTGLLNRSSFFSAAEAMIKRREAGYYNLSCFDIENFKVINDQYGTEVGDEILKHIAEVISRGMRALDGICCRYTADKFGMLFPASMVNSEIINSQHKEVVASEHIGHNLKIRIGRYIVDDLNVPISAMYDRATLAEESIRGRYDTYIAQYSDTMRTHLLREQKIINDMRGALENGEFQAWLQPQYNHATGALIGAEALVRWKKDGLFISPGEFVPIFERNGFIYEMDQYIWEQVCINQRKWLDEGRKPLPVSINISRRDLFHQHFIQVLVGIVEKYSLPYELIRLEVTESAFAESSGQIVSRVGELIRLGFIVEIDDFGSGYSSLNTLKDVPASILKLDMKFFENTRNQQRGGNIVESVVRMAKWLGMSVIAEGVEDKEQADYLKSIGCYYIQGYYYAKPMPISEYEKLLDTKSTESKLGGLKTLDTLDNNEFWDPKSMETLIFNSYVGGACIFEYHDGKSELLRISEQYTRELGGLISEGAELKNSSLVRFLDAESKAKLVATINDAMNRLRESACEVRLTDGERIEYIRITIRKIAHATDRYLFYGVIVNMTEQRAAEQNALVASERVRAVMDSSQCGITAVTVSDDGKVEYLFVNNRFYELLGYTPEQFKNEVQDPFGCIVPEDYTKTVEATINLREIGQTLTLQMRAMRRDGRVVLLRCDISIVRFADIPYPVQLSNFLDITEQAETEKRQLESARQLEIIMSNINGGVSAIQVDDEGVSTFVFCNNRYFELYGYTNEQASAEKLDVMTTIVRDDFPSVMAKIKKLKADRVPTIIDYRCKKLDGSIAYLRANSSLMFMEGYGEVITSVVTDITEQRLLSDKFKAVVDNISSGISATYTRDGCSQRMIVNDRYYELVGYTKEQFEAEVKDVFNLVHPDDRAETERKFRSSTEQLGRYAMEYRIIRRDGAVRHILCNTNVIHLFGIGEPVHLAVSTDITELREAQQKESEAADKLSTVLNHAGNGITAIALHKDKCEFLFANDKYFEIIGYSRELYRKATEKDDFAFVHPDDRERVRRQVTEFNKKGGSTEIEYRVIRSDGKTVWVRKAITITRFKGVDVPVQIGVFSDISAEKEANEQLSFLNDSAHDILAQPDSDIAINKTLEKLLTYFNGDRAYVVELNYDSRVTDNTYERCADGVESEISKLQNVPFEVSDYWLEALGRSEYVVIDDVDGLDDSRAEMRSILSAQSISSLIIAPLSRDGTLVGYVGIDNPRNAKNQLNCLKALGDYIAVLLTRRDLNRKIEHDRNDMQQLMNDTPGGFLRMEIHSDANPSIVSINEGLCKMLDMTHREVMSAYGGDVYRCLVAEDISAVSSQITEAVTNCGQLTTKCRLKRRDGELIWVMATGRFSKGETGKLYLNSYFTDITNEKHTEEQQKELLDNLPCGAALYEYDGRRLNVIHINKSYWELVGREPVDYTRASVFDVIHPDDKQGVYDEMEAAIREKRNFGVDVRILCGNSVYRPFHIDAKITSERNGRRIFYATYTPIPEQSMSLQQMIPYIFPAMMESSTDITFAKDKNFRYLCCSHAYARLLGLDNEKEVVGKSDFELFGKEVAEHLRSDDIKLVTDGKPIIDKMETLQSESGMPYYTRVSKYLLRDTVGNTIGVYGIGRDITERRETSGQLKLLANSIPGGLATFSCTTTENILEYYNDGFRELFGYTREEFTAYVPDIMQLIADENRAMVDEKVAELINSGTPIDCVYRIKTKDGGSKWVSHKAVIVDRVKNSVIVNAVFLDVTEQQEEKERLRVSEELNRLAIAHSGNIITRFDVQSRTLTLPESFNPIFVLPQVLNNLPEEQISLGRISPDTADVYRELFESIVRGKAEGGATYQQQSSIGWRWLEARYTTVFSDAGKPVYAVITFADVTEELEKEIVYTQWQQSLEERPAESYELLRCNISKCSGFDSSEGTLLSFGFDNAGKSFDEQVREYAARCVFDEDRQKYLAFVNSNKMLAEYYRGHRSDALEYREAHGGEVRWLRLTLNLAEYPGSKDIEAYLMYENIDEQKKSELLTIERSETDPLTGILNRTAFVAKMEEILHSSAHDERHALIMLDIDDFKHINDTAGHAAGDSVLKNLTVQVGAVLRQSDLTGRLGGDEFVVFLRSIPDKAVAAATAKRICELKIPVDGADITVTLSVGIAMVPSDGESFDELYKMADEALYRRKEQGKNGYMFADE